MSLYSKFSLILEKKFFYLYFFISILKNFPFSNLKILFTAKKNNLKLFNKDVLKNKKKSEIIFILGGGESINDITQDQWKEIQECDSLGINRWLIHIHVPTFMLIEGAKKSDIDMGEQANEYNYELLRKSNDRCSKTTFIFKDLDKLFINFKKLEFLRNRTYLMLKFIIPGKSKYGLKKSLEFLKKFKFFKSVSFPIGNRATITHALSFALSAGYKKIVLCGIDLHGGYFWENADKKKLFIEPPKSYTKTTGPHKTILKSKDWEITSDLILKLISKKMKLNSEQVIYVSSKKSKLSETFPIYW